MEDDEQILLDVRAVELGLDYTKYSERVMLQAPRCSVDEAQTMLELWTKVLRSTKQAQMQNENTADWPSLDRRPWQFKGLQSMPVVLWVRPVLESVPVWWSL